MIMLEMVPLYIHIIKHTIFGKFVLLIYEVNAFVTSSQSVFHLFSTMVLCFRPENVKQIMNIKEIMLASLNDENINRKW